MKEYIAKIKNLIKSKTIILDNKIKSLINFFLDDKRSKLSKNQQNKYLQLVSLIRLNLIKF